MSKEVQLTVDNQEVVKVTSGEKGTGILAIANQRKSEEMGQTVAMAVGSTKLLSEMFSDAIINPEEADRYELSSESAEIGKILGMSIGITLARADILNRGAKSQEDKEGQAYANDVVHNIMHGMLAGVQNVGIEMGKVAFDGELGEDVPDELKAILLGLTDDKMLPDLEMWAIILGALTSKFNIDCGAVQQLLKDQGITK